MNPKEWPDWLRRAVRTWLQTFVMTFGASLSAATLIDVADMQWWKKALATALLSAAVALCGAIGSALQNNLEDRGVIPAMLKAPASPGTIAPTTRAAEVIERHVDPEKRE